MLVDARRCRPVACPWYGSIRPRTGPFGRKNGRKRGLGEGSRNRVTTPYGSANPFNPDPVGVVRRENPPGGVDPPGDAKARARLELLGAVRAGTLPVESRRKGAASRVFARRNRWSVTTMPIGGDTYSRADSTRTCSSPPRWSETCCQRSSALFPFLTGLRDSRRIQPT